jgi:hypothetical protein
MKKFCRIFTKNFIVRNLHNGLKLYDINCVEEPSLDQTNTVKQLQRSISLQSDSETGKNFSFFIN